MKYFINTIHKIFIIFIIIFSFNCASDIKLKNQLTQDGSGWSTGSGNQFRLNNSNSSLKAPFVMKWNYSGSAGISQFQPVIIDSVIFTGFLNGELHAINLRNGKKIGKLSLESAVTGNPLIEKNIIYVPTTLGSTTLKAYDMIECNYLWKKKMPGIETSPLLIGQYLYVITTANTVFCIDKNTSNNKWEFIAPKNIRSSPASDSSVLVFGCDDGNLYVLDINSGKLKWKYQTKGPISATSLISDNHVYFGSEDGEFYCLELSTGIKKWSFSSGVPVRTGSAADSKNIYFITSSKKVISLDKSTGKENWNFMSGSIIGAPPVVSKNYLLVTSFDKKFYVLDKNSGVKIWEYEVEGRIRTSAIVYGNYVIFGYEDNNIIALQAEG